MTHSVPTRRSSDLNGVATVPATFYNSGTYSVTAEFVGGSGYTSSASAPQTLTVPGDTDGGPGGGTGSLDLGTLFRSEEHTSELQSLMRIPYAVFCLKTKTNNENQPHPYLIV